MRVCFSPLYYLGFEVSLVLIEAPKIALDPELQDDWPFPMGCCTPLNKKATAGLDMNYTLGLRHNFCCRGPI